LLTVFLLIALFGMVAFSVDVAYMHLTRAKLRSAVDAAARAASETLSRTNDVNAARAAAQSVALANHVAGEPLILEDEDIVPGTVAANVSGAWTFTEGGPNLNGVRVQGRRIDGSPSGPVNLFFGRVLGVYDFEPVQSSTVMRRDRDIVCVVDRSGSMKLYVDEPGGGMSAGDWRACLPPDPNQSRWSALEGAMNVFTSSLAETGPLEHVSLVSYASQYTLCGFTNNETDVNVNLTSNLSAIDAGMAGISATKFFGGTHIAEGINRARVVLQNNARPFAVKTMIVMTDGIQVGGGNPVTAAANAAAQDIVIYTITFSDAADQTAMQNVAAAGGGIHYHAPDAETLEAIYRELAFAFPVVLTE
jgi:hypothetical protein